MAIKMLTREGGKGPNSHCEFLCDTSSDVANLPTETSKGTVGDYCSAGSIAIIAEDKSLVILNNQGEWV